VALVVGAVTCGPDREEAHTGEKPESRSVVAFGSCVSLVILEKLMLG
jgi:coenzyme F420-reducing hydrogenase gamma subunit